MCAQRFMSTTCENSLLVIFFPFQSKQSSAHLFSRLYYLDSADIAAICQVPYQEFPLTKTELFNDLPSFSTYLSTVS